MKIAAIIQARMSSTRLPGKVMEDLSGRPLLWHVFNRVERSRIPDQVIVATSDNPENDVIEKFCSASGVFCYRGSEDDVLDRYYQAAKGIEAEVVVRITADCPLIDSGEIDHVIQAFLDEQADYASNILERTFPRGLDTEVMTIAALEKAWQKAREDYMREHVTPYLIENPDLFHHLSIIGETDYSEYRWTVDTREDLEFVRAVYERFSKRDEFGWKEIIALLENDSYLLKINRHIKQKKLHED